MPRHLSSLLHAREECHKQRCSRCSCTLHPRQSCTPGRTCGAALNICSCSRVVADALRAHSPGHMGQHRLCSAGGSQHRPLPALRSCLTVSGLHGNGELAGPTGAPCGALHSAALEALMLRQGSAQVVPAGAGHKGALAAERARSALLPHCQRPAWEWRAGWPHGRPTWSTSQCRPRSIDAASGISASGASRRGPQGCTCCRKKVVSVAQKAVTAGSRCSSTLYRFCRQGAVR